jgi:TolB protein
VPGKNGRIAFDSDHAGGSDIYTVKLGGGGLKRLTKGNASSDNPAWSPNGRRIAFERGQHIWLMNANGTHKHQVTHGKLEARDPNWSPDGRLLIFAGDNMDEDIWTIRPDGSQLRRITNTPKDAEFEPAWSPNGKRIAYVRDRNDIFRIVTSDPDGGRKRIPLPKFGDTQLGPAWSPNGRQLAFYNVDDHLFVMRYDGKRRRRVGFGASPAFSPDGKFVALSEQDEEGEEGTIFARRLRGPTNFDVSPFPSRDLCDDPDWQPR